MNRNVLKKLKRLEKKVSKTKEKILASSADSPVKTAKSQTGKVASPLFAGMEMSFNRA